MNSEVLLIWVSFIESFCGHPYEKQNPVSTNLCSKDVDEWSRRLHTSGILLMLGITTVFEYRNMSLSESTPNPEIERHPLILCGKFCPMPAAGVWVMDSVFRYGTSAVLLNHKLLLLISLFCPSEFSWCDRIPSWYSMRWLMPICHCLQVDVNGSKSGESPALSEHDRQASVLFQPENHHWRTQFPAPQLQTCSPVALNLWGAMPLGAGSNDPFTEVVNI